MDRLCTCDGVVHIAPGFAIVVFSSLDDHQVSGEVHPPGQSTGGNQNLRKETYWDEKEEP